MFSRFTREPLYWMWPLCCAALLLQVGCGTTKMHEATDQTVLSDAVDRSVAAIDFRPLAGRKVYLDTTYIRQVKGPAFVNADYLTSSLRQQVVAAGCLMQDSPGEADLIIEARCGTLGSDGHQTTYGIPASNAVSSVSQLLPSSPAVPAFPEISFARRDISEGAAKVAAFAYDRETRQAVWQSGTSQAIASAKDTWVLGVGPFQGGSIRDHTRIVGADISFAEESPSPTEAELLDRPPVDYTAEVHFDHGWPMIDGDESMLLLGGKAGGEPAEQPSGEGEVAVAGFVEESAAAEAAEAAKAAEAKPAP